jgi:light-regulated signal transduction histidine kinase (bacteriophytochrome)
MQVKIAQAKQLTEDSFVPLYADSLHDLASPVSQIATMFELFLKRQRKRPGSDDDEVLNLIQDSTARLQKLVSALQNYDRVAGASFEPRSCDSNALLTVAIASLHPLIPESGAQVMYGDMPRIHCDFNQMSYVFTSLLDNAIKFRGEDRPEVRISAASQGGDWLFSVRDNGIGIDPRHRESVFHMFKRIHGDRYPGAGAGLAITHRIVQRHGGRIWVESEPGHGSAFFLTLPFR